VFFALFDKQAASLYWPLKVIILTIICSGFFISKRWLLAVFV